MKTKDDKKRDDLGMPPAFQQIKIDKPKDAKSIKEIFEELKLEIEKLKSEDEVPKVLVILDDAEIFRASKSYQMISALFDIDKWLRDQIKYLERKDEDTLQEVRDKLSEIMQERNIDFDELYF